MARTPRGRSRSRHGVVEILDYAVAEDCGTVINPMIVDGQVHGRHRARHRHRALRGDPFRRAGPAARHDFADYMCPARPRCRHRVAHTETPAPHTRVRCEGLGEGGAIAPPAAIANAINDALRTLGAEFRVARLAAAHHRGDRAGGRRRPQMKSAPFDYHARLGLRGAGALADRGRIAKPSPAASRWCRCSTCGCADRTSWSTSASNAALKQRPETTPRVRRAAHACRDRGWGVPRRASVA